MFKPQANKDNFKMKLFNYFKRVVKEQVQGQTLTTKK